MLNLPISVQSLYNQGNKDIRRGAEIMSHL